MTFKVHVLLSYKGSGMIDSKREDSIDTFFSEKLLCPKI